MIEGCKEEDVSARRPPPPLSPLLTRTALKCLWVFMFVVFYRSGQEPGAVKVWKGGGRGGGGGEEEETEEEWRLTVNPIFIESDTNDKQRPPRFPANALLT